jgi:anion-transporting  ArsA/GET3 family ATPase
LATHFGGSEISDKPATVALNLRLCRLWARTGHETFLRTILPSKTLIRAALRSKSVGKFLTAAPSFHEMGIFYHLFTLLEAKRKNGDLENELIVIDMPATGHALALTALPNILLRLIQGGPIAKTLRAGQAYLNSPESGEAWVVTVPEQLPVTEALELLDGLAETEISAGGIILNRVPEDPFDAEERRALHAFLGTGNFLGEVSLHRISDAERARERLWASSARAVLSLPEVRDDDAGREGLVDALLAHMEVR